MHIQKGGFLLILLPFKMNQNFLISVNFSILEEEKELSSYPQNNKIHLHISILVCLLRLMGKPKAQIFPPDKS